MRTLPNPFASLIVYLKLVASLLGTLLQTLLTNIAILPRENALSAFLTALPHNVLSDVCTGIAKVSIKGVF